MNKLSTINWHTQVGQYIQVRMSSYWSIVLLQCLSKVVCKSNTKTNLIIVEMALLCCHILDMIWFQMYSTQHNLITNTKVEHFLRFDLGMVATKAHSICTFGLNYSCQHMEVIHNPRRSYIHIYVTWTIKSKGSTEK